MACLRSDVIELKRQARTRLTETLELKLDGLAPGKFVRGTEDALSHEVSAGAADAPQRRCFG